MKQRTEVKFEERAPREYTRIRDVKYGDFFTLRVELGFTDKTVYTLLAPGSRHTNRVAEAVQNGHNDDFRYFVNVQTGKVRSAMTGDLVSLYTAKLTLKLDT